MQKLAMVIIVVAAFLVGVFVGRMPQASLLLGPASGGSATTRPADNDATAQAGATVIPATRLTDAQRSLLKSLGIDADSITVTPQMIACAEAKLGAARITEITNGATPSAAEGFSLLACYR